MAPMTSRFGLGVTFVTLASLACACTTVLYKGPARPDSEISVLTSKDVRIVKVDSVLVHDGASGNNARYELLPGDHQVGVALNRSIPGFFLTTHQSSRPLIVCVELEAGHTYRFEAVINGARWEPKVLDVNGRAYIDPYCDDDEPAPRAASPSPPPRPSAALSPAVGAPPASAEALAAPAPDGGAAAPATAETGGAGLVAPAAAAPPVAAPPPAPVSEAVDRETPHAAPRATPAGDSSAAQPSDRRPGTGFSLFTGFAFGGSDFVKASSSNGNDQTLSAGQGLVLGVGAMMTPLWPGETVGLGLGIDAGLKYDSIDASNGSASITRYPIAFSAHMLTKLNGGDNYIMLKGGVDRDFGVSYSASGFASGTANPIGTWGPLGAFGYYRRSNDSFAWDIMAFFALTKHEANGASLNANSFGLTFGAHLNL
jgi:hypothetical protein